MVVKFKEENLMTFRHLFLKDYTEHSANTYAVYTQKDMFDHIGHVLEQVGQYQSFLNGIVQYW